MRSVALLALLGTLGWSADVWALSCEEKTLEVWPADGRLAQDGEIVLTAHGTWAPLLADVRARHPRLVNDAGPVALEVVEQNLGVMRNQVVLRIAGSAAKVGERYELRLDGLKLGDLWVQREGFRASLVFELVATPQPRPLPKWLAAPAAREPEKSPWACYLGLTARASGTDHFRVRVLDATGEKELARFRIVGRDGQLFIGQSACGGELRLSSSGRYRVALEAIDAFGRAVPAPIPVIPVDAPPCS